MHGNGNSAWCKSERRGAETGFFGKWMALLRVKHAHIVVAKDM